MMKRMEHKHGVVTQNVTEVVIRRAFGVGGARPQTVTLENIIQKANVKNGGLNYEINTEGA